MNSDGVDSDLLYLEVPNDISNAELHPLVSLAKQSAQNFDDFAESLSDFVDLLDSAPDIFPLSSQSFLSAEEQILYY